MSRSFSLRLFAGASVVASAALVALSVFVIAENRGRERALGEALFHEDARTALWQMEMRVATMLTAATYIEEPGQDDSIGWLACGIDLAGNNVEPAREQPPAIAHCAQLAADDALELAQFDAVGGPRTEEEVAGAQVAPESWTGAIKQRGEPRSREQYQVRQNANMNALGQMWVRPSRGLVVGPLATFWFEEQPGDLSLYFSRRVEGGAGGSDVRYETFFVPWDQLQAALLAEVKGLFPEAKLDPIRTESSGSQSADEGMRLASIPLRLDVTPPQVGGRASLMHWWPLVGAWAGLSLAVVCGFFGLRASLAYGDKHRRFTHAVTHELRTPLTTFRMYSEMLRSGMVPPGSEDEYLRTLEAESCRLVGLVENVLSYARLEEGGELPPRERLTASRLLESLMPAIERSADPASIEFVDESGDAELVTDPSAVGQVLGNLVENAVKYGAPVDGSPHGIRVALGAHSGSIRLDVIDQGPGITAEMRGRMFAPFDRAGRDSSDSAPGVGLGLALCRRLASQLGGRLDWVPAEKGATFRLTLPRATEGR